MDSTADRRRLTTILAADVVGYSRLMTADESGTLAQLKAHRKELIAPQTTEHRGRLVKLMGDGTLIEFGSVVDAVQFAIDVQRAMVGRNVDVPLEHQIIYRVGINIGDVIVEGDDLYGNGINVASRLEGLAEPGGIAISDDVYRQIRDALNIAWLGGTEVEVKNIERKIRVWHWHPTGGSKESSSTPSGRVPATSARKASIAVLAFESFPNDPELDAIGAGLVEDVLTHLQRFRLMSVISRNSSFRFKGKAVDTREIVKSLDADYFVEGSIRRAGNMARVTAQLIEAATDQHLWAERYDRSIDNPFQLQDDVSAAISAAIEPVLVQAINRQGGDARPHSDGQSALKRAGWHLYRFSQEDNARAIELLEQAIRENPNADRRYQALAMGHMWDLTFCWTTDIPASTRRAVEAAEIAVSISDNDAWNHAVLGWALVYAGDGRRAQATLRRALDLSPSSAVSHGVFAWVAGHCVAADDAITALNRSMELTPNAPFLFQYLIGGSLGHYAKGEHQHALELAESATLRRPNSMMAHVMKACAQIKLGLIDAARFDVQRLIELHPKSTTNWLKPYIPIQDRALLDGIVQELARAGLPESD